MVVEGFSEPWWLALLLPVAALGLGYVWVQRRRRRHFLRFANLELLSRVAPTRPGWSRHVPAALLLLALIALIVGLAGPTAHVRKARNRATVLLVVDVSLSMRASDVTPTRLAAAEDAAAGFVDRLPPTINVGLESFAGTSALLVSPTTDRAQVTAAIHELKLAEATATGEALATALDAVDAFNERVPGTEAGPPPARIVLMSDGKQTLGRDEFEVARQAAAKHVPVDTISFGTPYGSIDLLGQTVPVPVDDASLARVARLSGGTFYPAQSNLQIHQVYDTLREQIGYQLIDADTSRPWFMVGTLTILVTAALALRRTGRLPA
jgi:Ca-activated chloride channel family protein